MTLSSLVKRALLGFGLEVRRARTQPGLPNRPVGAIGAFLDDVKARGFVPKTLYDVGALRGGWTEMALAIFPETRSLMVEPQPAMEPHLRRLSEGSARIRHVIAGAGREPGHLVFHIGGDPASSSFLDGAATENLSRNDTLQTKVVTLDSLAAESDWGVPDLVKIDVQGYELEVLEGAKSLYGITELFIVEISLFRFTDGLPLMRECIQFMAERGYEIYDLTEFRRRPLDGALGQVDVAFARRDGFLRRRSRWA